MGITFTLVLLPGSRAGPLLPFLPLLWGDRPAKTDIRIAKAERRTARRKASEPVGSEPESVSSLSLRGRAGRHGGRLPGGSARRQHRSGARRAVVAGGAPLPDCWHDRSP